MAIVVDLDAPIPVYRQIVDAVRALLVEGRLSPGDRLPTVRRLASDLGVHHNTVAEAYRQLAREGWLELGRRRGATVCDRTRPAPSAEAPERFAKHLGELLAKALSEGLDGDALATTLERHARELRRNGQ